MDLYRNNYPPLIDTACDDSIVLVNKTKVAHSFSDSVFNHIGSDKFFSIDTNGTYQVDTNINIEVNGLKYEIAKVRYLYKGSSIDQEFLLYAVKNKGIYIQQESHARKLFLLTQTKSEIGQLENTGNVIEQMLKDTVLFPLPPR
jgi:hypothetical protein